MCGPDTTNSKNRSLVAPRRGTTRHRPGAMATRRTTSRTPNGTLSSFVVIMPMMKMTTHAQRAQREYRRLREREYRHERVDRI